MLDEISKLDYPPKLVVLLHEGLLPHDVDLGKSKGIIYKNTIVTMKISLVVYFITIRTSFYFNFDFYQPLET